MTQFDNILTRYPRSPRAQFGKARTLNALADKRRSNSILEQAIDECLKVLVLDDVPRELFTKAATLCADRQSFRGINGLFLGVSSYMCLGGACLQCLLSDSNDVGVLKLGLYGILCPANPESGHFSEIWPVPAMAKFLARCLAPVRFEIVEFGATTVKNPANANLLIVRRYRGNVIQLATIVNWHFSALEAVLTVSCLLVL